MTQAEREAFDKLQAQLKKYEEEMAAWEKSPMKTGVVFSVDNARKRCLVVLGGGLTDIQLPPGKKVTVGAFVLIGEQGAIMDVIPAPRAGAMVRVKKVLDKETAEVDVGGNATVVTYAGKVEKGDRVLLGGGAVIMVNLGQPPPKPVDVGAIVEWGDVGGLEEAKAALVEAIELPAKHPDVYKRYGQRLTKGVLLSGPPGCGKTMLGKAAMTALARAHGKEPGHGFVYVKGPEILNMYVGNSEENIRNLFASARAHKHEHGYPAIIFIDEADAIMGKRGGDHGAYVSRTIVPAFLAEMDGVEENCAVVILATNRPDTLDPAIVRDGRIDAKVHVPRPDVTRAADIFGLHLRNKPLAVERAELATMAAKDLYSTSRVMFALKYEDGFRQDFYMGAVASGAMIEGIVRDATTRAMRREIINDRKDAICVPDLAAAIDRAFVQAANIDHTDDIHLTVQRRGKNLAGIERTARAVA